MPLIARLGDFSNHTYNGVNGYIISVSTSITSIEGKKVAKIGDLHYCPIPGHGITFIVDGSNTVRCEGGPIAVMNSTCGCGAKLIAGSQFSNAPFGGEIIGAGKLNGPAVLGPPGVGQLPLIMG
jgi:uncharacterized Zn-binding protein involved in type VI secretion